MLRNILMLFFVFGSFVLEIKTLIYGVDTSSWWILIVSMVCFSLLGELFNKKLHFLSKGCFKPLSIINPVAIILVIGMKIPTSLIFGKIDDTAQYLKNTKYDKLCALLNQQNYYGWILCMLFFCVEMSLWVFFVKKIGWWIWLEVLVSIMLGSYIIKKEKSLCSLIASFLLLSPFFCMNFLGMICLIICNKK